MQDRSRSTDVPKPDDGRTPDADDVLYSCAHPRCGEIGTANGMFNKPCDLAASNARTVLPTLIRCRKHAEAIAAQHGTKPGRAASGVFLLSETLRRLRARAETVPESTRREHHERSVLDWYLLRKAAKYAAALATGTAHDEPKPARMTDGAQSCGLPIECCGHDAPAARFIAASGAAVGICDIAARAFEEYASALLASSEGRERLRVEHSEERALLLVRHRTGEHEMTPVAECPLCEAPKDA